MKSVFFDYNSTTPVDEKVLEAMLPCFTDNFGNAASKTHSYGWIADELVKNARRQVAEFIHGEESEIIFTSGATESINLAVKGVAEAYATKGKHIITLSTEHKAVLDCCTKLATLGYEISTMPVDKSGLVDLNLLERTIRQDTILVCAMLANNETGVVLPVAEISEIVHAKNSLLLSDTTQACGKITVDVNELNADLITISAHKMYGPKGSGALYVRRKNPRVTLHAQMHGGGHERNLRSGTLNVPGIVGLGKACVLAGELLWEESARLSFLRTKLEQALTEGGKVFINGSLKDRLPNTTNLCFQDFKADSLLKKAPYLSVATGSACSSAFPEPSHVLLAMGLNEKDAYASIRFSLGRQTTEDEIDKAIELLNGLVNQRNS